MPHPDAEHGLRVQLATALREANALHTRALNAEERAKRESEMRWEMEKERSEVNEALKAEMSRAEKAESERDALRAEVKRLREVVQAGIGTHGDPCSKGEDCQFMREARAALASGGDRG